MPTAELFKVTLVDQIAEVEREMKLRLQVYPRLIRTKKLTKERAEWQLSCMQAVLDTLLDKKHS